jgi:hypothetical protein
MNIFCKLLSQLHVRKKTSVAYLCKQSLKRVNPSRYLNIAPSRLIFNLGTRWPGRFTSKETTSSGYRLGGLVNARTGMDVVARRKIASPARNWTWVVQSLFWLNYTSSIVRLNTITASVFSLCMSSALGGYNNVVPFCRSTKMSHNCLLLYSAMHSQLYMSNLECQIGECQTLSEKCGKALSTYLHGGTGGTT